MENVIPHITYFQKGSTRLEPFFPGVLSPKIINLSDREYRIFIQNFIAGGQFQMLPFSIIEAGRDVGAAVIDEISHEQKTATITFGLQETEQENIEAEKRTVDILLRFAFEVLGLDTVTTAASVSETSLITLLRSLPFEQFREKIIDHFHVLYFRVQRKDWEHAYCSFKKTT